MRLNKYLAMAAAASVAVAPVAASAAQPVGSIVSVSGNSFVSRDGRLLRAQPDMTVNAGDRVIARDGGNASVALNGCSTTVAGGEMKTLNGSSCGSVETASFDRAGSATTNASALRGGGGFFVAIIAAIVVIVGIVIVAQEDDSPTSP